jgi:hypothetical protein
MNLRSKTNNAQCFSSEEVQIGRVGCTNCPHINSDKFVFKIVQNVPELCVFTASNMLCVFINKQSCHVSFIFVIST